MCDRNLVMFVCNVVLSLLAMFSVVVVRCVIATWSCVFALSVVMQWHLLSLYERLRCAVPGQHRGVRRAGEGACARLRARLMCQHWPHTCIHIHMRILTYVL